MRHPSIRVPAGHCRRGLWGFCAMCGIPFTGQGLIEMAKVFVI